MRVPQRMRLFVLGLSGLFGMRTPPEPEVVAHMAPAKGPEGAAPPPGILDRLTFERAPRSRPQDALPHNDPSDTAE